MVVRLDTSKMAGARESSGEPQLLLNASFGSNGALIIGRDEKCDIRLDGLQISNRHARLTRSGTEVLVEDLGSTNGIFINGNRSSRGVIGPSDSVQIGAFLLRLDPSGAIAVYDTRSKTRVDAVNLTSEIKTRGGMLKLLDGISLSIAPNEFVGLIGPSGAGKSSLIEALNGVRPAGHGNVMVNDLDLYRHFDSLKQALGYVPQDDIIHRELTVYKTLYYVAKLRLSRDVSRSEIKTIIEEVLDVTGLSERRNVPVSKLSGGQRKRVSIAVELITKPSVIFLDEPTSGLDPVTEDRIMRLFKQIAESGRTVIMTTHAMENVPLFDKIVILMRGKLVFYGPPADALRHFAAENFTQLFKKLEEPVDRAIAEHGEAARTQIVEKIADDWKKRFESTSQHRDLIQKPLKQLGELKHSGLRERRRLGIFGAIRQWLTLSSRYMQVLLRDKLNLFILLMQAPAIAILTFFVMGDDKPRDFVYFVVALVAVWFGTTVAAREIVRERPVYRRERMFNLGILPYVGSKLFILGIIVAIQCLLLFVPLKFFDLTGLMAMPGEYGGVAQFWAMLLTAGVGVALGLLISAMVRTSEVATSLVPLILIPQILFSGLVGVPAGLNKVIGLAMPSAWSFDTMKRFSTLDTLEPEGADPRGPSKGMGLYRFIETENEKTLTRAKRDLEDYKRMGGAQIQESTDGEDRLAIPEMKKIPEDLSGYVTFLHPWMNEVLNQLVLMLMFGMLVIGTLIVLKIKDLG
jgi:ABC transport system ATP-binding/permease protein